MMSQSACWLCALCVLGCLAVRGWGAAARGLNPDTGNRTPSPAVAQDPGSILRAATRRKKSDSVQTQTRRLSRGYSVSRDPNARGSQ